MEIREFINGYETVFEKDPEGGFSVEVPALPGCLSCGDDLEEARKMIAEAIDLYVDVSRDYGDQIPEPQCKRQFAAAT